MSDETEQLETTQFLKVRLMERDRQISDFQARAKKTEFKHNRDLKQARISEQRAKNLLKEEKTRCDRLARQLRQSQQQVSRLNLRLGEAVKERQRQVAEVRGLYNVLKEEVRGYERILPTLTFLTELGRSMGEIPTYEDVFVGLGEKVATLEQLQSRFAEYRLRSEQKMREHQQNEELLRGKKVQIESTLREVLPKMVQLEHEVAELRLTCEQLRARNNELAQALRGEADRSESLQQALKQSQLHAEQLGRAYASQLHSKQQQIRALTLQQFQRYEQQLRALQSRGQIKEEMYLQQMRILEEEVCYLQGRIGEEKEAFEESYVELKGEIDRMRGEVEREREEQAEVRSRYEEAVRGLIKAGRTNEQLEGRVQGLERKLEGFQEREGTAARAVSDVQASQMRNLQESYEELLGKWGQVGAVVAKLEEENASLMEEAATLRSEIVTRGTPQPQLLEIPSNFMEFQETIKKTLSQYERPEGGNLEVIVEEQETSREQRKIEEILGQLQKGEKERSELREAVKAYKGEMERLTEKGEEMEEQLLEYQNMNEKLARQLASMKKERERAGEEMTRLKEKVAQLTKSVGEKDEVIAGQHTNHNLLKTKIQSLQKENEIYSEQFKKQKQLSKSLREDLKQMKETNSQQTHIHTKQLRELSNQIQALKQERDRIKIDWNGRQKGLLNQLAQTKNTLDLDTRSKGLIAKLKQQIQVLNNHNKSLQILIAQLSKKSAQMGKQIQNYQQQIKKKQREAVCLSQALVRQRKQRNLKSVPSLPMMTQSNMTESNPYGLYENKVYQMLAEKQTKIHALQRETSDLREEMEGLRIVQVAKLEGLQVEQNHYIQTIIEMKMKCAESEMRAAESQHLYTQLKRRKTLKITN